MNHKFTVKNMSAGHMDRTLDSSFKYSTLPPILLW